MDRIRLLVALTSALFLFAGCGGTSTPVVQNAAAPREQPPLRIANGAEIQAIDPHITNGIPEFKVQRALFEGLLEEDPVTRVPVPAAAEAFSVSEDGLVWTFKLREGLLWSNGDPLTAEDWVYSLRRAVSPRLGCRYDYLLHLIDGARALTEGTEHDLTTLGVTAPDPLTLRIRLAAPASHFPRLLMTNTFFPVHRATVEAAGPMDERGTGWDRPGSFVGNGPFTLESWVTNQHVTVRRNPHYRRASDVRQERIVFTAGTELLADVRAFEGGQVDVVSSVPAEVIERLNRERPEVVRIAPLAGIYYITINTRKAPFSDPRVRRALALAVDRDLLVNSVLRTGQRPAFGFIVPDADGFAVQPRFEEDVDRARALLAEAGFPGGAGFPETEFLFNTSEQHRQIAQVLQQMWRENLGITLRLQNAEWKVFLANRFAGNFSLARAGWIPLYEDPRASLELFVTGGGNNDAGWSDPAFDALLDRAAGEPDRATRHRLYAEAEGRMMEAMPVIPLYIYTNPQLVGTDVREWKDHPMDRPDWRSVFRAGGQE